MSGPEKTKTYVDRKISQAGLAIAWERAWAALYPALMVLGLFALAVLSGLMPALPDWARFGSLAIFGIALLSALVPVARLVFPGRPEAIRRIETASGLAHRPVAGSEDRLADGEQDQLSATIWQEHRTRQLRKLGHLKIGMVRSNWMQRDRYALRIPLILALFAAVVLGRTEPTALLADSVRINAPAPQTQASLDAWIAPPGYTGRPPLMLTSPAMRDKIAQGEEIIVPENSHLKIRVSGAKAPRLAFYQPTSEGEQPVELPEKAPAAKPTGDAFQIESKLARPMTARVFDGDKEIAQWTISLIPDNPPQVAFDNNPTTEANGALSIRWKASDDYGVAGIEARVELSDMQDGELGVDGNGVFLFDPPEFPIALKRAAPKEATGTSVSDLTAHPWAGLTVDMRLIAKDQTGQTGESEVKSFKLPEREFQVPLAKALIEQRKALVMNPDERQPVVDMLDALLVWPQGLVEKSGPIMAIGAVTSRIRNAKNEDDIRAAIDFLWQIAVSIEDGDVTNLRAELERIKRELEKALAEGAPPEKVAELMQKLREAMNDYLKSMAQEAQRRMEQGGQQRQGQQQGQMVRPEDLAKMLDTIEKLAQSGAKEAAQELLSQLDDILRNLQPGMPGQNAQGDTPLSQMLNELSEMMKRQQQLMDDTTRLPEDNTGEGEQQEGAQGQQGKTGELAGQQDALGRMLEELMGRMGQNGLQSPPSFGEAGRSMEGAADALRGSDRGRALSEQGEALSRLREGAQSMAREMQQQQGMGTQGNQGRHGEARGDDRDPLGRPMPRRGEDFGPERDMLPSELAVRRAREILEMLRERANMPDLRRFERDYFDRLLRGLY
ncbi:MAG: TIGR02302 family protein [Hyphomicrobiales bacterium]